jgi:imidazolonepropionase-like amidohydrolase
MTTLLINCTVVDCAGNPPLGNAAILIDGDRIRDVGQADELEARINDPNLARVDLDGATVIPGLWDAHIHLGAAVPPHDHALAHEAEGEYFVRAIRKAQDNLRSGVTSLRALSDRFDADVRLRNAIGRGLIEGPRIFASGDALWSRRAGGPDEFRRRVRDRIQAGVDVVKIFVTAGIPSRSDKLDAMICTEEELRAAVAEAHKWNKSLAVHAMGDESIAIAAAAGADTVEHGFVLEGDGIEAMAAHGTTFCPNLAVTDAWDPEQLEDGVFSEWLLRNAEAAHRHHHAAFRKAVELGVPIVAGVDNLPERQGPIGIEQHRGRVGLVEELRLMIANGLSPELSLAAATREAARAARAEDVLGTIEPGKLADLVAIDGNPLDDIDALLRVRGVWKGGRRITLELGASPRREQRLTADPVAG